MQRPQGVWITFVLMCITNALGLFLYRPDAKNGPTLIAISCILVAVGYVVLWFYLKGSTWARWMVMFTSLLALWNLKHLFHPSPSVTFIHGPMIVAEALLASFLLVYLNTRAVRTWFEAQSRGFA